LTGFRRGSFQTNHAGDGNERLTSVPDAAEAGAFGERRNGTKGPPIMFVAVIHRIHDTQGFQAAEAKALEQGLPPGVKLPIHASTKDHTTGICIWEGKSVDAVREVVESVVGAYSKNEYLQMDVDGLKPQL